MNKKSRVDGTGKANIVPKAGEQVVDLVYEIDQQGLAMLEQVEKGYELKPLAVVPHISGEPMHCVYLFL